MDEAVGSNRCPRLIKVDVEGMEASVLRGAIQTLSRCQPLLYLENQCLETSRGLLELLDDLDYACWWDPSTYFSPDNFMAATGERAEKANSGISLNVLCLRDRVGDSRETGAAPSAGTLDLWTILGDVLSRLKRVQRGCWLIEEYNPVPFRPDAGGLDEANMRMAACAHN
mmetsp:Transcript_75/g.165  ORF Transcript_75/g.165 Transcript_75/m.165 type:complete len:170 (+) Transcript_75:3-512(+)